MKDLFLSLGSNVEPMELNLTKALKKLSTFFELVKVSSLYESEPLEDIDQDLFYNICAYFKSNINEPKRILQIVKEIEKKAGRIKDKSRPKGPRIIDIDIIFLNGIEVKTALLTIPHEKMHLRKFVLKPLIEILPKDSYYYRKYNLLESLRSVEIQKIKNIGEINFEQQ